MELMRGGKSDEPSNKDVEELMVLANEVLAFVYRQKYKKEVWRVRAMAAVFGRMMGASAVNRAVLMKDMNAHLELARERALHYMALRESGQAVPPVSR